MERAVDTTCSAPDTDAVLRALRLVALVLERPVTRYYQGRFHFKLTEAWTLAIRPESANRFRVEACKWSRPGVTLWSFAGDDDRLVALAEAINDAVVTHDQPGAVT